MALSHFWGILRSRASDHTMSKRRDRVRRPGRRAPFRDPRPTILIVCEGERTEPEYLNGFWRACRNPRVLIHIPAEHGTPKTLVDIAKAYKNETRDTAEQKADENIAYDQVWCVFDIDDHPNVADAKQMARDNGIELAISNPCFELWLLVHFRDSPGMRDRAEVQAMLTQHVPDCKHVDYTVYFPTYLEAVARATRMDQVADTCGTPGHNPSTNVYKLTELIRTV